MRSWRLSWARPRPLQIAAILLTGLAGAWAGMLLGGHVKTPIGPASVALSVRPAWSGGTVIEIPPLGTLYLDSHWGPLRLSAQVAELRPEPAQRIIENPGELDRLSGTISGEVAHGLIVVALRALAAGVICGMLAGLVVFRSWQAAVLGGLSAFSGILSLGMLAWATFNPSSVTEPRYTGLLAGAPQFVGDARTIVHRFSEYRAQLARLVGNVSRLYEAASTLPTYEPDPSTVRVLQVSDIHLNPLAWSIIRPIVRQFQIQLIIDSGDLTDHGSHPEEKFANDISTLKVPYVFVRGNHDSLATQKSVARQPNAVVLDGTSRTVEGLRIWGVGDPRFTPDKTTRDDSVGASSMSAEGVRQAALLASSPGPKPDIVVVHDPLEGAAFDGIAPLILTGHVHVRSTRLLPLDSRLFIQGSTGGAGLRGLEGEHPTPIELSILYFDRATHRLQGWDDLKLGGLGLTSAQIERTLEDHPNRPIPALPPSITPSGDPAARRSPP
ncbi:MAG TPA: metallophosphoesterase [Streptosporangiaceae bacterium]|nr:metallophosphoesterase [Streptosporangiaceae bacterium]